jgi:hypothetical protein
MGKGTRIAADKGAVVAAANGHMELLLPDFKPDEAVPEPMLMLTAFFIRLHDDEAFRRDLLDWLDKSGIVKTPVN